MGNDDLWRIYRDRLKLELRAHTRKLKIYETRFCDNIRNPNHEGYDDCLYELKEDDEEYEEKKGEEEEEEKEYEDKDKSVVDTAYDIVETNDDHLVTPIKKIDFLNIV